MEECIACGSELTFLVADLGESPLANSHRDVENRDVSFPLQILGCHKCSHLQVSHLVEPSLIFNDKYSYVSGKSEEWKRHCLNLALAVNGFLGETSQTRKIPPKILEIGSNDGTLLLNFMSVSDERTVLGIEPSLQPAKEAMSLGIPTEVQLLNSKTVGGIKSRWGQFDIVIGTNVFAHTPNPLDLFKSSHLLLNENGILIVEIQNGEILLNDGLFDMIYHEHYSYFTPQSLIAIGKRAGFTPVSIELIPTHGGSLRGIFSKSYSPSYTQNLENYFPNSIPFQIFEKTIGLEALGFVFRESVQEFYSRTEMKLKEIEPGFSIIGIGAPAKLTTMLNAAPQKVKELFSMKLDYIYDVNPLKGGMNIPGTQFQIRKELLVDSAHYYWIFGWNYSQEFEDVLQAAGVPQERVHVISPKRLRRVVE